MIIAKTSSAAALAAFYAHFNPKLKCMWLAMLLLLVFALATSLARPLQAQTYTVLHTFTGGAKDGAGPYGGVVDVSGTFYGATSGGGASGNGVVFKVTSAGKENVLHSFQGPPNDGATPGYMNLITDGKGNFYGTTNFGGNGPCKSNGALEGCGTIFKITSAGKETVLYNFQYAPKDGAGPNGTMVMDSAGNLYGTAIAGGNLAGVCMSSQGCGIVFEYTSAGAEKVLYTFCPNSAANCPDGAGPSGALVRDAAGNLYGATVGGGSHLGGTVFEINSAGKEKVLYNFCTNTNCTDGAGPIGGLALDEATGVLYGTTLTGGTGTCGQESEGGGTIFQVTTSGKNFEVLHSFASSATDGCNPYGTVTMDGAGDLYGTTLLGGTASVPAGTVWKLSGSSESLLYSFSALGSSGFSPQDTLFVDAKGNLYGTTWSGGASGGCAGGEGCGTVFKITP